MNNDNYFLIKKNRLENMAKQVIAEYKEMQDELSQLDEWEWENDFDFTIVGLMEVFSSYVGGYASQIATRGTVLEPEHALQFLESKYLFDQPYFVDWYFSPDNTYLKIKQYVNHLDHLRLMLIEYITRYQSQTNWSPSLKHTESNEPLRAANLLQLEPNLTAA